jgi:BolA family transcriptional regulator, general stress-responsive regulator
MEAPAGAEGRVQRIRSRLESRFAPQALELIDESARHAGHAGARTGRGHFRVRIVAAAFDALPRLQRHRLVYEALGPVMEQDIHALTIEALAPSEVR